jgi:hypothetical protein
MNVIQAPEILDLQSTMVGEIENHHVFQLFIKNLDIGIEARARNCQITLTNICLAVLFYLIKNQSFEIENHSFLQKLISTLIFDKRSYDHARKRSDHIAGKLRYLV